MGFSKRVTTEAMVRSGRRCCVCRAFKGLFLETHHIVPQAAGGPDTLDNAIVLCFDCHANAGHYNPDHPKGTKFSPTELRGHRDRLWTDVAEGRLSAAASEATSRVHVRYLMCRDAVVAKDILDGAWERSPFAFRRVMQGRVAAFMHRVLRHERDHQRDHGRLSEVSYDSFEALCRAHPEFALAERRALARDDLDRSSEPGWLIRAAIGAGADPSLLGEVSTYENECGDHCWTFHYDLRRTVFAFVEVWNRSEEDVTLVEAFGDGAPVPSLVPLPLPSKPCDPRALGIAPLMLAPGEAVAIPVAVLLEPLGAGAVDADWTDDLVPADCVAESLETIAYYEAGPERAADYASIGPRFLPDAFELQIGGDQARVRPHRLDMSRSYVADRIWLVGSCPHVVFDLDPGGLAYAGEVLTAGRGRLDTSELRVPDGAVRAHLCEFEPEVTTIMQVERNGEALLAAPVVLRFGDRFTIEVAGGDSLRVTGRYEVAIASPRSSAERRQKRSMLSAGLRRLARDPRRVHLDLRAPAPVAHQACQLNRICLEAAPT